MKNKLKKNEIDLILEDWKLYELDLACKLVKDIFCPSKKEELIYIGLEHIAQQDLKFIGLGNSKDIVSNKFRFKLGQILFGKLRPYFRKVVRPKFSGVCSTDIWVIDAKEGFVNSFLFYFWANPDFIKETVNSSEGTRMPRAKWEYLSKLKFMFPPLPEQQAIASVLSSFDDKIELLEKQNETLEKIGEVLFKNWFIDFEFPNEKGLPYKSSGGKMVYNEELEKEIPQGWEVKSFMEVADVDWGDTKITKSSYKQNGFTTFSASGPDGFRDKWDYDKIGIVMSAIGAYCGKTWFAFGKWSCIKNTIRMFGTVLPTEYLFFLTKINNFWKIRGAAQPFISKGDINSTKIVEPNKLIILKFETLIKSNLLKVYKNQLEILNLKQTRDLLLPKLMSGKIRVI